MLDFSFSRSATVTAPQPGIDSRRYKTTQIVPSLAESRHAIIVPFPFDPSTVKLHPSTAQNLNTITGYGEGYLEVNGKRFGHALMVVPDAAVQPFDCATFDELEAAHLEWIAQLSPEVVLLGTGTRQRFLPPEKVEVLSQRRIGIECMDTRAACRTYNILMAEGRKVAAVLLLN